MVSGFFSCWLAGQFGGGRALSGHGSQSLIILHFSPFGGGEGDGRKTVTKLVINAKRYFHLLSFFFFIIQHGLHHEGLQEHVKLSTFMFWQPLSVVRICSFFMSSVQLVFYDGGGGGRFASSGIVWASRLESVLSTPRSGQGRGARVASDPDRELIPSDRGLCLDIERLSPTTALTGGAVGRGRPPRHRRSRPLMHRCCRPRRARFARRY